MKKALLFILAAAIVTMILMMCGGSSVTASGKDDTKENGNVQAKAVQSYYEETLETKDQMEEVKEFFAEKAWYQKMPEDEQTVADLGVLEAIDWYAEMGIH